MTVQDHSSLLTPDEWMRMGTHDDRPPITARPSVRRRLGRLVASVAGAAADLALP